MAGIATITSPTLRVKVTTDKDLGAGESIEVTRDGSSTGLGPFFHQDGTHTIRDDTPVPRGTSTRVYNVKLRKGAAVLESRDIPTNLVNHNDTFINGGIFKQPYVAPTIDTWIKQTGIADAPNAEPNHLAVLLTYPPLNMATSTPTSHLWRFSITNNNTVVPLTTRIVANKKGMGPTYARSERLGTPSDLSGIAYPNTGFVRPDGTIQPNWAAACNVQDTTFGGDWAGIEYQILAALFDQGLAVVVRPGGTWTIDVVFPFWTFDPTVKQPDIQIKTYDDDLTTPQEVINVTATLLGA